MGTYHQLMQESGIGGACRYWLVMFRQPVRHRLAYLAYERWTALTWPVMRRLDRPMYRWHEQVCTGCAVGPARGDLCAYLPPSCRQDCRAHDLDQRERVDITQVEISLNQARLLGWTSRERESLNDTEECTDER